MEPERVLGQKLCFNLIWLWSPADADVVIAMTCSRPAYVYREIGNIRRRSRRSRCRRSTSSSTSQFVYGFHIVHQHKLCANCKRLPSEIVWNTEEYTYILYIGADCNLNRWNLWNSVHINSSRVFISIIFYDAALIKKHDTLLHLSLFMEYFIQFLLQRLLLFSLIFLSPTPNSHSPPLACVALNESLKCKYINTKLLYEYLACPNWHFGLCFIAKGAPK